MTDQREQEIRKHLLLRGWETAWPASDMKHLLFLLDREREQKAELLNRVRIAEGNEAELLEALERFFYALEVANGGLEADDRGPALQALQELIARHKAPI